MQVKGWTNLKHKPSWVGVEVTDLERGKGGNARTSGSERVDLPVPVHNQVGLAWARDDFARANYKVSMYVVKGK